MHNKSLYYCVVRAAKQNLRSGITQATYETDIFLVMVMWAALKLKADVSKLTCSQCQRYHADVLTTDSAINQ